MTASELASIIGAKPIGNGYLINCPCHNDKNPSLQFYDNDYNGNPYIYFHCYAGCKHRHIKEKYQETGALNKAKVYFPEVYNNKNSPKPCPQESKNGIKKDFSVLYLCFLDELDNSQAMQYLQSRGIPKEYSKKHWIMNLPEDKQGMINIQEYLLRDNKYTIDDLIESGLFIFNKYSHENDVPQKRLYCTLSKHRLIIPYILNSKVQTLQGRVIDNTCHEKTPKMMNLKNRAVPLYNQDALQHARETHKKVCICEGPFDVLSIYALGLTQEYGQPVGIAGVNNYKNLLALLDGLEITVAADNDEAGRNFRDNFMREYKQKYGLCPFYIYFKNHGDDINDILLRTRALRIFHS